jgi:hypothetical protein
MSHEEKKRQTETLTADRKRVNTYFDNPVRAEGLKIFILNQKDRLSIAGGLYLVLKG